MTVSKMNRKLNQHLSSTVSIITDYNLNEGKTAGLLY